MKLSLTSLKYFQVRWLIYSDTLVPLTLSHSHPLTTPGEVFDQPKLVEVRWRHRRNISFIFNARIALLFHLRIPVVQ